MSQAELISPSFRVANQQPNIWVSIGEKVAKYKPLNLGQGFPDFRPKEHVLQSLLKVAKNDCNPEHHQRTRSQGHLNLVRVLAKIYSPLTWPASGSPFNGAIDSLTAPFRRRINPETEILISVGAYGCLSAAFNALVTADDEVIIIEPAFDCYTPMTLNVGGKPVYVSLRPPSFSGTNSSADWVLDFSELESKLTEKTKVLVLNTPNNPLGKVYTVEELEKLAAICIKHELICFADEVYEWLVFPPNKHVKIASFPGMWERTLTIGSAGKTFNVTGWKTGWAIGPEPLISAMQRIQEHTLGSCSTPLQEALATSLEYELPLLNTPSSYFKEITLDLEKKLDVIISALTAVGMKPVRPQGGYFLLANIENIPLPDCAGEYGDGVTHRDVIFNDWMMINKGLSAIPPSVFYCNENKWIGEKYLRFCAIKEENSNQFKECQPDVCDYFIARMMKHFSGLLIFSRIGENVFPAVVSTTLIHR